MPGFMDTLKEAGKSLIGMVDKAVIIIVDKRSREKKNPVIAKAGSGEAAGGGAAGGGDTPGGKDDYRMADPKVTKKLLDREKQKIKQEKDAVPRALHVQFNPKSLQLTAYGGGMTPIMNFDSKNNGQPKIGAMPARIDFHVQLVFDRVNNQDAFMNERFVLNPTAIAKGAATGYYVAAKGKAYEVQTEVEALLAALNGTQTREMVFVWGHLIYKGRLNTVDAAYTMFNTAGAPIRATVDLAMTCEDMAMWESRYYATFTEDDGAGGVQGKNRKANAAIQKKIQNMLNL